ncbi:MAG TPA: hexitol phosphatase HxpB [Candidatus Dormibacteraeota bacterium]
MIRGCVFDMDGVLIDTEPVWRRVEHDVFARVGVELTEEQLRETWGLRIEDLVEHWYRTRGWKDVRPRAVQAEIVREMVEHVRSAGEPLPGAVEAVRMAHEAGLRVGIASSSAQPLIDAVVHRLQIADVVDATCTADDEVQGKPDPAVYLSAARRLGIEPQEGVAVEDSPFGVVSAKRAGMLCVAVRTEAVDQAAIADADLAIDSLRAFTPELLRRLQSGDIDLTGYRATG